MTEFNFLQEAGEIGDTDVLENKTTLQLIKITLSLLKLEEIEVLILQNIIILFMNIKMTV